MLSSQPSLHQIAQELGFSLVPGLYHLEMAYRNPYMDKISTFPDFIFGGEGSDLSSQEITRLNHKLKNQPKIFLELGSGSGGHLITLAQQNPDTLCIGIEKRYKRAFRTAEKASELGINNLCVVRSFVSHLKLLFTANSIDRVYVNYPDPWEKKHWIKNRMLSPETLPLLAQLLKPSGLLSYKTDHPGYFADTLAILKGMPSFEILKETSNYFQSPYCKENISSEFEQLFLSQGLPIFFLEAKSSIEITARPSLSRLLA